MLNMAVIVGFIYFGQNHKFVDETAVKRAVDEGTDFLLGLNRDNVMIEINNESNVGYVHEILQPDRVHELVLRAKERVGGRLLVSTSYGGGGLPSQAMIDAADYILLHGNGQGPDHIRRMVETVRARPASRSSSTRTRSRSTTWWRPGSRAQAGATTTRAARCAITTASKARRPTGRSTRSRRSAFFDGVAELVGIEKI